jgi:tRNA threonylcarbamoyladenosine biosynthesis protein TsaB
MDNILPMLAVETSSDLCSVAVMIDDNVFVELNYLQKHVHSEKLIDLIDDVLKNTEIECKDLKSIAISIGPGSFTGLRIGLAAVKGIGFGCNLPLIPVPSDVAHAFYISHNLKLNTKFTIVTNANIDELYFSKFIKTKNGIQALEELHLVEKSNLKNRLIPGEEIFGNVDLENVINTGYGLTATSVSKWAYLFGKDLLTFDYDYLEPNYFKKFVVKVKS